MLAVFTVALALGGYQYKAEPMPIAAYNLYSKVMRETTWQIFAFH
ncbi:hypothetical protein [Mesorhizobium sp. M0292]